MNITKDQSRDEVATAWSLWKALNEHAEVLWDRYEAPFMDLIMRERSEQIGPVPPESEIDLLDDIPF